jgi:hypothetical protein
VNGDKSFKHTLLDIETLYQAGIIVLRNLSTNDITLSSLYIRSKATGFDLKGLKEDKLDTQLMDIKTQIESLRINSGSRLIIIKDPEPYDFTEDRMERIVIALK